jgi:hypothetical protein
VAQGGQEQQDGRARRRPGHRRRWPTPGDLDGVGSGQALGGGRGFPLRLHGGGQPLRRSVQRRLGGLSRGGAGRWWREPLPAGPCQRSLREGLVHDKFQPVCGGETAGDQSRLAQPLPESVHRATVSIGRPDGVLIEQEHQPGQPRSSGLGELHFGVRDRLARHDRSVPETDNRHVDLALPDPFPAVISWPPVPRREIRHVNRRHPRLDYPVHDRPHERTALREHRHIRGVRDKYLAGQHLPARPAPPASAQKYCRDLPVNSGITTGTGTTATDITRTLSDY